MTHRPGMRTTSAIVLVTMLAHTVAFAAGGAKRKLHGIEDLDRYAAAAEERRKAEEVRAAENTQLAAAERILQADLHEPLARGGDDTILAIQNELRNVLARSNEQTRGMIYRVLGQNIASFVHHPTRLAHIGLNAPSAAATGHPRGPYGQPAEQSAFSGADLDERAVQVATTAKIQSAMQSSRDRWYSGVLGRVKAKVKTMALLAVGTTMASYGVALYQSQSASRYWVDRMVADSPDWISARGASVRNSYFSISVGAYRRGWQRDFEAAPEWAQGAIRERVLESAEFAQMEDLERKIHDLVGYGAESFEARSDLLHQAVQTHIRMVLGLRQWLTLPTLPEDPDSQVGEGFWGPEARNLAQEAQIRDGAHSALDNFLIDLLVRGLLWATVGVAGATALLTLLQVTRNIATQRDGQKEVSHLHKKLAEGYLERCRALAIEPSAAVLRAFEGGNLDEIFSATDLAAAPLASCEASLSGVQGLRGLSTLPRTRVEAPAEAAPSPAEALEDAVETGHGARQRQARK